MTDLLKSPFHLFAKEIKEGLEPTESSSKCKSTAATLPPNPSQHSKNNPIHVIIPCSIVCIGLIYVGWYILILTSIRAATNDPPLYPKLFFSFCIICAMIGIQVALITMISSDPKNITNSIGLHNLICCIAVMVPTFIIINSIQSLSAIYENTISVFILKRIYTITEIIKLPEPTEPALSNTNTIVDIIFKLLTWDMIHQASNIKKNINQIISGVDNIIVDENHTNDIQSLILKKNLIGNFIWMSSASIISTMLCVYSS